MFFSIIFFRQVFLLASNQLISEGKSLHSRPISAILFFRPLTYLITGAKDGSSMKHICYPSPPLPLSLPLPHLLFLLHPLSSLSFPLSFPSLFWLHYFGFIYFQLKYGINHGYYNMLSLVINHQSLVSHHILWGLVLSVVPLMAPLDYGICSIGTKYKRLSFLYQFVASIVNQAIIELYHILVDKCVHGLYQKYTREPL